MREYGLMIIWEKARDKENIIISDIKKRFSILDIFDVKWDKERFSENLTRFYGENLPPNSFKERHCGNGPFVLLILEDKNPVYAWRPTSHGKEYVNVNFYDSKEMYRSWTGKHRVHATNNKNEFSHDLAMLLGVNVEDYSRQYCKGTRVNIEGNIAGSDGWKSLDEMFYILNETSKYVVLRNFDELPGNYRIGEHSDLDLLCENRFNTAGIINGKNVYWSSKRTKYRVKVDDSYVNVDIRYVGDNYYDAKWELDILRTRVFYNGLYIPEHVNYMYSLLYHALIQKKCISDNYFQIFFAFFGKTENRNRLYECLLKYMEERNYQIMPAMDYSVYFNRKLSGIKPNYFQIFYFGVYPVIKLLEKGKMR